MTLGIAEPSGSTGRISAPMLESIFRAVASMVPDASPGAAMVGYACGFNLPDGSEVLARACTETKSENTEFPPRARRIRHHPPHTSGRKVLRRREQYCADPARRAVSPQRQASQGKPPAGFPAGAFYLLTCQRRRITSVAAPYM